MNVARFPNDQQNSSTSPSPQFPDLLGQWEPDLDTN